MADFWTNNPNEHRLPRVCVLYCTDVSRPCAQFLAPISTLHLQDTPLDYLGPPRLFTNALVSCNRARRRDVLLDMGAAALVCRGAVQRTSLRRGTARLFPDFHHVPVASPWPARHVELVAPNGRCRTLARVVSMQRARDSQRALHHCRSPARRPLLRRGRRHSPCPGVPNSVLRRPGSLLRARLWMVCTADGVHPRDLGRHAKRVGRWVPVNCGAGRRSGARLGRMSRRQAFFPRETLWLCQVGHGNERAAFSGVGPW